jgi:hypothetical protein
LREGDPSFKEDLVTYSRKVRFLQIPNFKDDSSPLGTLISRPFSYLNFLACHILSCLIRFLFAAWDCSAWVRTYAQFLEERLECFRILKYDIDLEHLTKASPNSTKVCTFSSISITHYMFNANFYHCLQKMNNFQLRQARSKTGMLTSDELLEQLPALQQLLYRLICCQVMFLGKTYV